MSSNPQVEQIQAALARIDNDLEASNEAWAVECRRYGRLVSLALRLCDTVMNDGEAVPMAQDLETWIKSGGPVELPVVVQ